MPIKHLHPNFGTAERKGVLHGPSGGERAIESDREDDSRVIADRLAGADDMADLAGDGLGLRLGEAGVEHDDLEAMPELSEQAGQGVAGDWRGSALLVLQTDPVLARAVTGKMQYIGLGVVEGLAQIAGASGQPGKVQMDFRGLGRPPGQCVPDLAQFPVSADAVLVVRIGGTAEDRTDARGSSAELLLQTRQRRIALGSGAESLADRIEQCAGRSQTVDIWSLQTGGGK